MAKLDSNHKSTNQECIPCQELLERIDADLGELEKEMAAARANRVKPIAVVMVPLVVAVGAIVAWWLFA
jgi:hypothetical protein